MEDAETQRRYLLPIGINIASDNVQALAAAMNPANAPKRPRGFPGEMQAIGGRSTKSS